MEGVFVLKLSRKISMQLVSLNMQVLTLNIFVRCVEDHARRTQRMHLTTALAVRCVEVEHTVLQQTEAFGCVSSIQNSYN
jgi:hypothetical protein